MADYECDQNCDIDYETTADGWYMATYCNTHGGESK